MLRTDEVIKAIINSQYGWAVAEQFEDIYHDRSEENISKMNFNALDYIVHSLNELIDSDDIFTEYTIHEMMDLRSDIKQVLDEVPSQMKNDY